VTIASLTAATAAPAPKGAASPLQTATVPADAQTAAITTEAPALSNLETAVAAARQSAATRQDGLSTLMANLLRASGNLPTPVQQAVDQLLALHLPTDVAPDAAAVKTALLTSGLFTEANLASNPAAVPVDIKTALLQLNSAAQDWLARPNASSLPQSSPAAQAAVRAGQTVLVAIPDPPAPTRRSSPRSNEAPSSKTPNAPQPSTGAKSQPPVATSAQTDTEAETINSAIRLLGQVSQALKTSAVPELPKEISAALVLVNKAITLSLAAPDMPDVKSATPPAIQIPPATPPTQAAPITRAASAPMQASPEQRLPTSAGPIAKQAATAPPPVARPESSQPQTLPSPLPQTAAPPEASREMPQALAIPGFAPRGSSPVEQLLALQLAPALAPVADVLPPALPASTAASPSLDGVSLEAAPSADIGVARTPPVMLAPGQPPAKLTETIAAPSPPAPPSAAVSPGVPASAVPSSPSFTSQTTPSLTNDTKALLTLFAGAVKALLPRISPAAMPTTPNAQQPDAPSQNANVQPPTVQPQQPATADITAATSILSNAGLTAPSGVPNDLKTLLLLFNMVAENWLPRATAATSAAGTAGTPSVPPPVRGAPSKAQPAALATLPENADPVATAKQLLSGSDAALARHTLLQIASLPDAAPQSRDGRWVFDVPLMTPQGAAVAQMIIERDGRGTSAEKPVPVWRVQFAIDIEPLGPVRANLALSGDRAWVTISADRPESLDKLQSGVSWLADALQSTELEADIAFQPGLPAQRSATASRFMDNAS
jgi:hypothetical protein